MKERNKMTQLEFLKMLKTKYQFTITGYGEKEVDIQITPNKTYSYFLLPYSKRVLRHNIFTTKQGELFTTTTYNYIIKDYLTGEISHAIIGTNRVLYTTLYQRDLIILDKKNEYDKKLAIRLSEYEIIEQKRVPLFYRTNKDTFLKDLKGAKHE